MPCRCIQISAEVRAVVLRSPSLPLNFFAEWNSGDRSQTIVWNSTSNAEVVFHSATLQTQTSAVFTEIIDQAEWGTLYYAMKAVRDSFQLSYSTRLSHSLYRGKVSRTKSRRMICLGVISRATGC